jgi:hypothetical protein
VTVTAIPLNITPGSFAPAQRLEAVEKATPFGCGVHMAVGNSMTRFYADPDVEVGKVRITMPLTYKGLPEYIKTLDTADEDWCPRENDGHLPGRLCVWCMVTFPEPELPDQPDDIDEANSDYPDPKRAADRVNAWISEFGDGLIETLHGQPLYARDLAALARHALTSIK